MSMSLICGIHCLAMPFVLGIMPVAFSSGSFTEFLIITISAALATYLLVNDFKKHRKVYPLIILSLGVLILFGSHFTEVHAYLSAFAGMILFSSFMLNRFYTKKYNICC